VSINVSINRQSYFQGHCARQAFAMRIIEPIRPLNQPLKGRGGGCLARSCLRIGHGGGIMLAMRNLSKTHPRFAIKGASIFAGAIMLSLAACQASDGQGGGKKEAAFDGIGLYETIYFTGTEPFWGGQTTGKKLTYSTPETPEGKMIAVKRFAGNHGLGISGVLGAKPFDMVVTPGDCSDGMSDRTYPITVTLRLAGDIREGCGWTDARPWAGMAIP